MNILSFEVVFDTAKLEETLSWCEKQKEIDGFYADMKLVKEVGRKQKYAENRLSLIKKFDTSIEDIKTIFEMLTSVDDEQLFEELKILSF